VETYFSVLFDETTDLAKIEQMSLHLRYFLEGKARGDFIKCIDCYKEFENRVASVMKMN